MNNKERKELRKIAEEFNGSISALLLDLQEKIQEFADNEQEKMNNMPEGLQYSERYDRMQEYVEALEGVCSDIDSVMSEFDSLIESIDDISYDNI